MFQHVEQHVVAVHMHHVKPAACVACGEQHAAVAGLGDPAVAGFIKRLMRGVLRGEKNSRATPVDGRAHEIAGDLGDHFKTGGDRLRMARQVRAMRAVG